MSQFFPGPFKGCSKMSYKGDCSLIYFLDEISAAKLLSLLFYHLRDFKHQFLQVVFHRKLIESKSPLTSLIFLSILTDINSAVVQWFRFFLWCLIPQVTFQRLEGRFKGIICNWYHLYFFHTFFSSQARSRHLSIISFSLSLYSVVNWSCKIPIDDKFFSSS